MINVQIVPIIPENDNYAFILKSDSGQCAVVDPGDAAPIRKVLEKENLKPDIILITHHHWDHTDGIKDMLVWHKCPVVGPEKEKAKIPALSTFLKDGENFTFGGEPVQVIETPGHTAGHICFYFPKSGFLLAGDTMFIMGCGRLFEGTPEDMFASFQKLKALPDDTVIYCAHEYSLKNAQFCASQEQDCEAIQSRLKDIQTLRDNDQITVPTTLAQEKETNSFLRAESAERFAALRAARDCF